MENISIEEKIKIYAYKTLQEGVELKIPDPKQVEAYSIFLINLYNKNQAPEALIEYLKD